MTSELLSALSHLNTLNTEVSIYRFPHSYYEESERWSCTLTLSASSTELKVAARGPSAPDAILSAYAKLQALIDAPAVSQAFALTAIEGPVA